MVIKRKDNVVNLCEIKFYSDYYLNDLSSHLSLERKINALKEILPKKCSIFPVLISTYGLNKNEYSYDFNNVLVLDDLFVDE